MANHKINIIVLGDGAVGKTSLLKMYAERTFQESHMATLGLDYVSKTYQPKGASQELQVKIWDTAGQERFRAITSAHYRKSIGALIVYDITQMSSFESVQKWIDEVKEHAEPDIVIMLVGNKLDLCQAGNSAQR